MLMSVTRQSWLPSSGHQPSEPRPASACTFWKVELRAEKTVLTDDAGGDDAEAKRARQVRALLVWAELFGDEAVTERTL